jgi:hypothetical protein
MDVRDRLHHPDLGAPPPESRGRAVFASGRRRRRRRRAAAGTGTLAALLLVAGLVWPQLTLPGAPVVDDVADAPTPPTPDPDADPQDPDPQDPDPQDPDPASEPTPDPAPTDPAPESQPEATEPPSGTGTAPPVDDDPSTADRVQAPDGPADLVVADVRVGVHDGFDRVVVELAGDGRVGWFTELGDTAFEDGSGASVDVDGGAVLTVMLNAVAFPPDLPDPSLRWEGPRVPAPADAVVLTEVVDSIVFEAQHQLFVGLAERVPYRIVRLEDPQRVVIDLLHP